MLACNTLNNTPGWRKPHDCQHDFWQVKQSVRALLTYTVNTVADSCVMLRDGCAGVIFFCGLPFGCLPKSTVKNHRSVGIHEVLCTNHLGLNVDVFEGGMGLTHMCTVSNQIYKRKLGIGVGKV